MELPNLCTNTFVGPIRQCDIDIGLRLVVSKDEHEKFHLLPGEDRMDSLIQDNDDVTRL
jgi:hypothetical protein